MWAIGVFPAAPIPVGGFGYGLAVNPAALIVLPGFGIADLNGEFRMPFPATSYPTGQVIAQGLFVAMKYFA